MKFHPFGPAPLAGLVASLALLSPSQVLAGAGMDRMFAAPPPAGATDRLIVKYRESVMRPAQAEALDGQRAAAMERGAARAGVSVKRTRRTALGAEVMKLGRRMEAGELARLVAELKAADPEIEYIEPDRIMRALLTPNDSRYSEQWDLYEATGGMRLPAAWDVGSGSGVVVAVLDTGFRPHADLAANLVAGYDFISDAAIGNDGNGRDSDASDPGDWTDPDECGSGWPGGNSSWHGTHVAGTIAAVANNGAGVAGMAYSARVQPLRVLGRCGGYTSDIADAIVWASGGSVAGVPANATPARVINMSLGGGGACDQTTQSAINTARSRGTVVVVAAGNENQNASNASPANCQGVITVAATGRYGARAYYSNFGTVVTLAAPGGDMSASAANGILSTLNAGTRGPAADSYAFYQGTSMATPHVAALAAMMIARKPALTPDEVKATLVSTVRAFPGTCSGCGAGLADAAAAMNAVAGGGGGGGGGSTTAEVEPNNSRTAAMRVTAPAAIAGTIASRTDADWYRVELPAGRTLRATLTPGATSDYDLYITNATGTVLARSEQGTGKVDSASVSNTGAATSTRYVQVKYYAGGTGSSNGKYTLSLSW